MNPAETALKVLGLRKGFDGWWHEIESDIQDEIKAALNKEFYFQFPGIVPGLVTNQKTEKP